MDQHNLLAPNHSSLKPKWGDAEPPIIKKLWHFLSTGNSYWIARFIFIYAIVFFGFERGINFLLQTGFLIATKQSDLFDDARLGSNLVFSIFMVTFLLDIWTRHTSPLETKKRLTTYIIAINIVGIVTYVSIYYALIPPLEGFVGRPVHPSRYIEWIMATPTLIVVVSELDTEHKRDKEIRLAIYYDIAMQVTGLFSAVAHSTFWYSFWLIISCLCFLPVIYNHWVLFTNSIGNAVLVADSHRLQFLRGYTMVEWTVFPFVFIFAFADMISVRTESIIWCILDVGAKVVYSLTLLNSSFWSIQQFRRLAETREEKVMGNAGETSTRIQEFQAMLDAAVFDKQVVSHLQHTPIGRMSANLREPLSNIIAFNSLLLESEISYEHTKLVSYAITSADSLLATVNNITEYITSEEKGIRANEQQFDLLRLLEQIGLSVSWKERFKSVNFLYEYSRDCPALVEGDAALLYQALTNVVDHALNISATGKMARVKVSALRLRNIYEYAATPKGKEKESAKFGRRKSIVESLNAPETDGGIEEVMLRFTIICEGVQTTAEEMAAMFVPFTHARVGGNMGLGMVVAKRIVEALGGVLTVCSDGNVYFPALEERYRVVNESDAESADSDNASTDDDERNAHALSVKKEIRAGQKKEFKRKCIDRLKYRNFLFKEVKSRLKERVSAIVAMEDINISDEIPEDEVEEKEHTEPDIDPWVASETGTPKKVAETRIYVDIPFRLVSNWRQEIRLRNSRPLEGTRIFLLIGDKTVNDALKAKLSEWGAFCSDDATLLLDGSGYCWFQIIIKEAGVSDSVYEWFLAAEQRQATRRRNSEPLESSLANQDLILGEKPKKSRSGTTKLVKPFIISLGKAAKELGRRKRKREREHLEQGQFEFQSLQYPFRWNELLLAIANIRSASGPLLSWMQDANKDVYAPSPGRSSLTKMLREGAETRADPRSAAAAAASLKYRDLSLLNAVPPPQRPRQASGDKISTDGSGDAIPVGPPPLLIDVLMVDDMPINIRVATAILTRLKNRRPYAGLQWDSAKNGKEGVEKVVARAATRPYDVVLMDVQMPIMNGYEATKEIRRLEQTGELTHRHKIVAMTSDKEDEVRQGCLESGMDVYLTKPLHSRDLEVMMGLYFGHAYERSLLFPTSVPSTPREDKGEENGKEKEKEKEKEPEQQPPPQEQPQSPPQQEQQQQQQQSETTLHRRHVPATATTQDEQQGHLS